MQTTPTDQEISMQSTDEIQTGRRYYIDGFYQQDKATEVEVEKAGPKVIVVREIDPPLPAFDTHRIYRRDITAGSWTPAEELAR